MVCIIFHIKMLLQMHLSVGGVLDCNYLGVWFTICVSIGSCVRRRGRL